MRVFICLEIPKEIKKIIKKIQEDLPEFEGKKTEEENLHLTLKFLGEVNSEILKKIKESLSKIRFKKFKAKLGKIGVFDDNFVRIVWIKVENCNDLQKEIDENLYDIFEKERRFISHLTIARVKKLKNKNDFLRKLELIEFSKNDFLVDSFYLKESILTKEKPIYTNLGVYFLS
ncbi:MAG: RNA 2',3'-cyclic phosphodiesterase [Candidatus Pacearchaeota archaeon]